MLMDFLVKRFYEKKNKINAIFLILLQFDKQIEFKYWRKNTQQEN
jgi:hypothetical protein